MDKNKLIHSASDFRKVEIALSLAKASDIPKIQATTKETAQKAANPNPSESLPLTTTRRRQPSWIYPEPAAGASAGVRRGKHPRPDKPAEGKQSSSTMPPDPKIPKKGETKFFIIFVNIHAAIY